MNEYKQFWLATMGRIFDQEYFDALKYEADVVEVKSESIHVIEYAALEAAQKRIEDLQSKLDICIKALEFLVDRYFDIPIEQRMVPHLKESEQSKKAREALASIRKPQGGV